MPKSNTHRAGETPEAKLRRDTQLDLIDEEIERIERMISYAEENTPRTGPMVGAPDGLYVNLADRDKGLVHLGIRRKLQELRDSIAYNGHLS